MSMKNIVSKYMLYIFIFFLINSNTSASEIQPVMGAGPSTPVVNLFFKHFSELDINKNYSFSVEQRSIKHAGGIKASSKYLFGRTGRPLNEKEKQLNKQDLFIARIPLGFAVGHKVGVDKITLEQLQQIVTREISNWKEVGGVDHEIILIGRESTEAAFQVLKAEYPFFRHVKFDRLFKRDHQVVNYIQSDSGDYALAFGAKANFNPKHQLKVDDFYSGVQLGLVYDLKNAQHPVVKAAMRYAQSEQWFKILENTEFLPPLTQVSRPGD